MQDAQRAPAARREKLAELIRGVGLDHTQRVERRKPSSRRESIEVTSPAFVEFEPAECRKRGYRQGSEILEIAAVKCALGDRRSEPGAREYGEGRRRQRTIAKPERGERGDRRGASERVRLVGRRIRDDQPAQRRSGQRIARSHVIYRGRLELVGKPPMEHQ